MAHLVATHSSPTSLVPSPHVTSVPSPHVTSVPSPDHFVRWRSQHCPREALYRQSSVHFMAHLILGRTHSSPTRFVPTPHVTHFGGDGRGGGGGGGEGEGGEGSE